MPEAQKSPPPCLRQELNLYPAEADLEGAPSWMLHDPLSNRYFRIGELEMNLLLFCGQGDEEKIAQLATLKIGYNVTTDEVAQLFNFLRVNNLTLGDDSQKSWYAQQQLKMQKKGWLTYLAKSYLFFRIPFWKSDRFLTKTLNYVAWLGTPPVFMGLALLMLMGGFLALRQLDRFISTFLHFFNAEGFGVYMLTLGVIKLLHELGHAYTAKKMGCKVPIIGVAFLVAWPVLYTDTSDAWKLNSRRKRMNIGIAGVAVELGVAIICLFCWSLAAEGMLKSVFFLLATTTWIMSILVNFNPLMRFDGYYLMSDWLRLPNLESRSFAMAKWWLREKIFNLNFEPPEPIQKKLVYFSFAVWTYRFFLFLGIATLVYLFFFKALGIILFLIEIVYFILRPLWNELKQWQTFWPQVHWNYATLRSSFLLLFLIGLAFIPWRSSIEIAGFVKANYTAVYAPVSGQITKIAVKNNDLVQKQTVLIEMEAPELVHEKNQVEQRYKELSWQRAFLGFNKKMRQEALIVNSSLVTQNQRLRNLLKKYQKLTVTAVESGIVVDKAQTINAGDWIAEGTQLLAILDKNEYEIVAYLKEAYLSRVQRGSKGYFHPEHGNFPITAVEVTEIESMSVRAMDALYSASLFGGDVAVRENKDHELLPVISVYKIRLKLLTPLDNLQRVRRGTVVLQGEPESFIKRAKNNIYSLFRRESGF
ncbi:MAG: HlyD family efflux transporter periplasmic adaptor subunit [Methylococcales bacterium]|nr:HlyD family efflux transporter periplasmic adaptor subunit [Methylococcales bacterium]